MKKILFTLLLLSAVIQAKADVYIASDTLCVGVDDYRTGKQLVINGYDKIVWQTTKDVWFKIDLGDSLCISSCNDKILFYDNDRNDYIGVIVKQNNTVSDSTLKTNIQPLQTVDCDKLTPLAFSTKQSRVVSDNSIGAQSHYGFDANQLRELFPQAVIEDGHGNLLIDYNALIPVLVRYLQSLDEQIDRQSVKLDELLQQLSHKNMYKMP